MVREGKGKMLFHRPPRHDARRGRWLLGLAGGKGTAVRAIAQSDGGVEPFVSGAAELHVAHVVIDGASTPNGIQRPTSRKGTPPVPTGHFLSPTDPTSPRPTGPSSTAESARAWTFEMGISGRGKGEAG